MSDKSSGSLATLTGADLQAYLENPIDARSATRDDEDQPRNFPAYVGFRGAKAEKNVEALDAAGVKALQFYLRDGGEYLPLSPCDVHTLRACTIYTLEQDGELLGVSFKDSQEQFEEGYRAMVFATVAVRMGNGVFVPASLILRGGQTKALSMALQAIDPAKKGAATDPKAWATRSPRHAASAEACLPGLRFFTRIHVTREKPEDGGAPYNLGHGTMVPTPKEDIEPINAWFKSDQARIAAVLAVNDKRIADARAKADASK